MIEEWIYIQNAVGLSGSREGEGRQGLAARRNETRPDDASLTETSSRGQYITDRLYLARASISSVAEGALQGGIDLVLLVFLLRAFAMASVKLQALWNHPAGPKTIHFWAPLFKWGISIANIVDFTKPTEMISYPQQAAMTGTGLIWARYSMVINPKNWNLFSVSCLQATTGLYQLSRKVLAEEFEGPKAALREVEKQAG